MLVKLSTTNRATFRTGYFVCVNQTLAHFPQVPCKLKLCCWFVDDMCSLVFKVFPIWLTSCVLQVPVSDMVDSGDYVSMQLTIHTVNQTLLDW